MCKQSLIVYNLHVEAFVPCNESPYNFFFILLYSTTVIESLYDVITVESVNKIALNTQIFYQFKRLMDGSVIL